MQHLHFRCEMKRDTLSFLAYQRAFADKEFWKSFGYSNFVPLLTIFVSAFLRFRLHIGFACGYLKQGELLNLSLCFHL